MPETEWQVAFGSQTLHLIDTEKPSWTNPDGSRRRNGPRSRCGRYPQRNAERPWASWPMEDLSFDLDHLARVYSLTICPDCKETIGS